MTFMLTRISMGHSKSTKPNPKKLVALMSSNKYCWTDIDTSENIAGFILEGCQILCTNDAFFTFCWLLFK